MVSPQMPETPKVQTASEVLTLPAQQFEMTVDRAFAQHYQSKTSYQVFEATTLLKYMTGKLDTDAREKFQQHIAKSGGASTVVATVKAARQVSPGASLESALASQLIRGLMGMVTENAQITTDSIRGNIDKFCFKATIDTYTDDDLNDIRDDLNDDNTDNIIAKSEQFTGAKKAFILGAAGNTQDAQKILAELNIDHPLNAQSNNDQADNPIARLKSQINSTNSNADQVMQSILAFAHQLSTQN